MTDLTVRSENLLAAIGRGKLLGSASAGCARPAAFLRGRRTYHRIEAVAAETPGITSEVGTSKKDSDSVDRDEPDRQWFEADTGFTFFSLNRSVHFLHIGMFPVIHP